MKVLLLFFSLAIWCSAAEEASEPYYLVTAPSTFAYPSEQKACVVLSDLKCAVDLKLELVTEDSEVKLLVEDKIDEHEHSQCYTFQVPDPTSNHVAWNFRVSINGDNVKISENKKVHIYKGSHRTFIQTDKSLYKPEHSVHFRVVTLDEELHANDETIPLVEIKDPNDNKIAQWRDVKPVKGIADLSFPLADEAPVGEYTIILPRVTSHTFSVTEYEKKNFEVDIIVPDAVYGKEDSFHLEVCARYIIGKPVQGSIKFCVCEPHTNPLDEANYDDHIENSECQCYENLQIDSKGCSPKDVNLHFFNLTTTNNYFRHLSISAAVKEHGTGRVEKTSKRLQIGSPKVMNFVGIGFYYRKGIRYTGMLKVLDSKNKPKANVKVFVIVSNDEEKTNVSLVTDEKGIAHFSLATSGWTGKVAISGVFELKDDDNEDLSYSMAYRWLYPFYSASNSFLELQNIPEKFPCDTDQPVKVEYSISKNDLNPDCHELKIYYLFTIFGKILSSGEYNLNVKEETSDPNIHGSFTINIERKQNPMPFAQLLVYTLLKDGAVTGDHALYRMSTCFKNKVKLEFSEKEVHPREKVKLDITADPGSMCSVRSVDKGLLMVKPHEQFFHEYDSDMEFGMYGLEYGFHDMFVRERDDTHTCSGNNTDSDIDDYVPESRVADVSSLFSMSHVTLLTNTKVHKPVSCPVSEFSPRSSGPQAAQLPSYSQRQKPKKPFIRSFLPETWLFDLVSVGDDGHKQLSLTTPDSITKWETDAFCLSSAGYGQAEKVHLNTVQPFFTNLIYPNHVKQGEDIKVKVQVFNYLEKNCLVVGTWLAESAGFKAVRANEETARCICPEHSEIFTWKVKIENTGKFKLKLTAAGTKLENGCPEGEVVLGNKDIEDSLEETITVEPSGIEDDETKLYRICPGGGSERQDVVLKLPDKVVAGSEHADIIVFGDILSNAVINLEDIFNMPTGCGEQNIAFFVVNLHVLHYLKNTNQMTPEIQERIRKNLITAYHKQLSFKNENGSFSMFTHDEGNIWLTAKVVSAFSQAREIIHINEKDIQDSLKWLSSMQLPSGCFQQRGGYFNHWLEDTHYENVRLAAFISIAMMESGGSYEKEMLEKAMTFVKNEAKDVNDTSTLAVLAYTATLSGDDDLRKHMLEDLEKEAKHTDLYTYWEEAFCYGVNIETTSYVALALLTHKQTSKETEEATKMINWIASKQSSHGGYYSTTDTVLALRAIAKFAESTAIQKGDASVSVRSLSGFQKQFIVDKDQGILLQKASLPDIPGEYVVTVTGGGCVYVQTHLHYHVPVVENEKYFALSVSTRPTACTYQAHTHFEIVVELSYTGSQASSNMVMVEVKLLSGFKANKKSVEKLLESVHVKRTEIKDEMVILYLDEVTHDKLSLAFSVIEETHVDNLQPATVLVFCYYVPEHNAVAEYCSPCHEATE